MSRCCTQDNKGTALPSACDSGVLIPEWGVPERFEYEEFADPLVGVEKFSEWQLVEADSLFRFEYVHKDDEDDGMGPGIMQVELFIADDDAGTGEELIAKDHLEVPYSASGRYFSTVVEMLIPAGKYFRVEIFQPLLLSPPQGPLPGLISAYTWSNATLSSMENQS